MARLAASGARAAPDLKSNTVHEAGCGNRGSTRDSDNHELGSSNPTFLGRAKDSVSNKGMLTTLFARASSLLNNALAPKPSNADSAADLVNQPLNALLDKYWHLHWRHLKSRKVIELALRRHLRPEFGDRICGQIRREEVAEWHEGHRAKHSNITNKALRHAREAWNKLLPEERNPFNGVRPHPERVCNRQFTDDERARWVKAFAELLTESRTPGRTGRPMQEPTAAALWVVRGSLARTDEILNLRRDQIDVSAEIALIEEHKTDGEVASKTIYLSAVMDVIRHRCEVCDRTGTPWLFPSRWSDSGHVECLRGLFYRVCKRAGIVVTKDLRPHMLRGDGASLLANEGTDIRVIQKILGHSSIKSTARYTNPSQEKARRVVVHLGERLGGTPW